MAGGERRIVSILFADVAQSTGIGERLGPERSKFLFDEVIRLMTQQVERYEGTVAQLAGDGLLALFGAPVSHEDDAERAARSALELQRALRAYAGEVAEAYGVELAARVAVNTGPVVVTSELEAGERRWNALGDSVNVAARLQDAAGAGGIVVGEETARQIRDCFTLEPLGRLELRGRTSPVEAFRLVAERAADAEEAPPPLVGRDFELPVLARMMEGLVEGRGVIGAIRGEPGIGKSRLVAEMRQRFGRDIRFIEGRAVSYAQAFPYWPVRDLLREWLGVGATTPEARIRLELKAELAALLDGDAGAAYPFVATLLGLAVEPDASQPLRELNREAVQRQTFEAFAQLVCRISAAEPLCLVFEDLHWADDSTLDLLESLLWVTEQEPVGILLVARSEREHRSWQLCERARQRYPHRYREIELDALPDDAVRRLTESLADGPLPPEVSELLGSRAGGNPFFLEEALHDLVEGGSLRRGEDGWQLTVPAESLAIPARVQGALQARLDRLEPDARETLNIAAVTGRTFGLPLLERLVPRQRLLPALSELQRLELIVEARRRPAPEYRFRHGVVQEVAYGALLEPARRRLHLAVAEALEAIFAESGEMRYELLARHFSAADDAERAADYLLRAGDAARAVYADHAAVQHYRAARTFLARLRDDRRSRETLFKIALTHHLAFDFQAAEAAYDEAFSCRVVEEEQPEPSERLELALGFAAEELAPGATTTVEGASLLSHLFAGLVRVDRDLNVVPAAADNFRVSGDGRSYLFQLRAGLRWSDGVPVSAEDFVFGWNRLRESGSRLALLLQDIEEAVALDERTLEVRLVEPRSFFPYVLAETWALPWPRHAVERLGDDWRRPENLVCNGPYLLASMDEEGALLRPNPYWVGARGNAGEIAVALRRDSSTITPDWLAGRFDVVQLADERVLEAADTVSELISGRSTTFLGFRANRGPFRNLLLRQAVAHAVDGETAISRTSTMLRPAAGGGFLPPAMPGHSRRVGLPPDRERARALLAEAGHPDGHGLPELGLQHQLGSAELAEALAEQLREIGLRIRLEPVEHHAGVEPETLWLTGWVADYPDPDGMFRGLVQGRSEGPFYHDEEIDELLVSARRLHDRDERIRCYTRVDQLWVGERAAIVPIGYGRQALARRPWIDGVWANAFSGPHIAEATVARAAVAAADQRA